MDTQLLQFLGSLIAILVLSAIAWGLKLGPERKLESEAQARLVADYAIDGFEPVDVSLDSHGRGALLQDAEGRILLLRPHGTHFAGRLLTAAATARIEGDTLNIDTSEKRFGPARLTLVDATAWVQRIEAIE